MGGSPKNSRDNEGNTGKFGVGFKSVYLVCDRPKVVSDAIDFEIIGGFYPRPIGERFKDEILKSIPQHFKRTTIIRLDLNENFIENKNFLNDFKENAPYLPLFGLAIDEVTLKAESGNQTYKFDPFKGFGPTQKFCAGNILENSNTWKVIAHFRLGKSAKLLLEIREKKFCKINKASNIWVTVPTDERLGLGFILNAPFNLDIGRAKLHRDKARNQKIVDGFRKDFKDGLLELWKYAKKEKLESNYEFWNSLWELFGPNLVQRFRSDEDQSGLDLIELLLWGDNQATGYGWFISEKRVVPNGIESNPKLLKKGEVEYKICSKLAEHLETIKEWGHLNKILSTSVSQNVERILSRFLVQDFSPQFFGLNELVSEDPVWFNGKQANKADAERLGSLFTEQLIGKYDVVYSENNPWKETQKTLSQIRFQSKANQWKDPKELLFSSQSKEDTYTNIETLLCRFAPDEVLLCDEITTSEHAITFFKTCRDEFKCPKESTILNWCSNFSSVSTKTEFLKFLIFNSKLTDSICHRIATNDHIPDWLIKEDLFKFIFKSSILSDREKAVIIGKLFPETLNNLYTDEEDGEPEDEEDHYREHHFTNSGEYIHLILK
jgi:hypothetical protein